MFATCSVRVPVVVRVSVAHNVVRHYRTTGFFPCALAFVWTYYKNRPPRLKLWALAVICLQPPLLLIDHGHFQYNAISLGLTVC